MTIASEHPPVKKVRKNAKAPKTITCPLTSTSHAIGPTFRGWSEVAQLVPGKNDIQCREKWYNNLDPTVRICRYSKEEDELLKKITPLLGSGSNNWTLIATYMEGRSDASVRARYKQLMK
eukprot:gene40138-49644_t